MKAIETEYAGVRFRSRLEARWAVFFDALGIRWEYEPEAFELSDRTRYLPDFWLPEFVGGIYVEVKPLHGDFGKAERFALEKPAAVWLCEGPPDYRVTQAVHGIDGQLDRCLVLPNADSAEGENRFFAQPGYEQKDGSIAAGDRYLLGDTFLRAVAAVRAHRFWNPHRTA